MEDEDEVDVLGEFNLENLLTKNEEDISSCYDGEHHLGLHCDSPWMLDAPTQSSWYDNKPDPQPSFGGFSAINSDESFDNNTWSDKEKYLLEKGLELFGRSWSRLAQYIGTKGSSQVKSYVKALGIGRTGKSFVSTSSYVVDNMDFNFTELIDDMEIPASMEEVIAAVSTAQPTVVLPSSQREITSTQNPTSSRKTMRRRKKYCTAKSKRSHLILQKSKEQSRIYNAEDIKDVLTDIKEHDSIILPSGEEVIRMRHGSSLSEDSDVDIDIGSEKDIKENFPIKEPLTVKEESEIFKGDLKHSLNKASDDIKMELFQIKDETIRGIPNNNHETFDLFIDDIENEVSVFTDDFVEERQEIDVEKETQIFKGNLITPSGKVMTVIVEDMPSCYSIGSNNGNKPMQTVVSKYMTGIQEKLDTVFQLPTPTQEIFIDPNLVTQEEELLHSEFFSKSHGRNRYLKIRNHIIDCWKSSKPNYVTKTSVRSGLRNCGDVNLISRIHAYLEQKGYINFGCEHCHYNSKSNTSSDSDHDQNTEDRSVQEDVIYPGNVLGTVRVEKRESCRVRKKKLPFEEQRNSIAYSEGLTKKEGSQNLKSGKLEYCFKGKTRKKKIPQPECDGDYTLVHTESGEVIVQQNQMKPNNKINTRGIKPVKLIHCKNYSTTNKAPYRVELDVSALLLVDVHSHLSPKNEVIGLLGGTYSSINNVLTITIAVPCRTVLSSNIHCDMCPVSQCESSELITNKGLSVVGWYHSHPNFDPSPSDTDVDTQNTLQSWFNETGKPFVGVIISPYFPVHNVSSYRCCQVKMENNGPMPYQLEVKLINPNSNNLLSLRQYIDAALETLQKNEPMKHLNIYKCLESVKHHLKKATPKVEEDKVSHVLQEIRDFFKVASVKSSLHI